MKKYIYSNHFVSKILLVLYLSIFMIGEFNTMDRMSPQMFVLSILNTLTLFYFAFKSRHKESKLFHGLLDVKSINFYYLLIFISMVLSLLMSINISESLISLSHYFNVFISFFCLTLFTKEIGDLKNFIFPLITFILLIESSYVFYSIIDYYLKYEVFGEWTRTFEIRGFTANINITAFSLAYKVPFLIFLLKKNFKNKINLIFLSIFILIVIFNIFHLSSRGGILSLLIILGLYISYLLFSYKYVGLYLLFLSIIGLSTTYYVLKDSDIANPLERTSSISLNTQDGSVNQRLRYYTQVLDYVLNKPITPIGVGMYKIWSIDSDKEEITQYIVPLHTHNDFLELLIENGIVSFLSYLLIFIVLFKSALSRLIKDKKFYYEPILLFIGVYFIDSLLNFPIARPVNFLFFNAITAFIINDKSQ